MFSSQFYFKVRTFLQQLNIKNFKGRQSLKYMQTQPSFVLWMVGPGYVIARNFKIVIIRKVRRIEIGF